MTYAQQAAGELQVLPVRGNVFMIMGGGGHVTLSAGIDGMLLVDTGSAAMAEAMLAKIKEIGTMVAAAPTRLTTCVGPNCYPPGTSASFTPWGFASPSYNAIVASPAPLKPLRWIIQTHFDPDHVGGTPVLAAAGSSYAGGNLTTILGQAGAEEGATLIAQENVLRRMTETNYPEKAWALETFYTPIYKMSQFINGEGIVVYHAPAAITDGDSFVHFRYSDVISAGDLYTSDRYPDDRCRQRGHHSGSDRRIEQDSRDRRPRVQAPGRDDDHSRARPDRRLGGCRPSTATWCRFCATASRN